MRIACVHQGYELYGSDRCFAESVAAIRAAFPEADIEVVLPRRGPIGKCNAGDVKKGRLEDHSEHWRDVYEFISTVDYPQKLYRPFVGALLHFFTEYGGNISVSAGTVYKITP